jgi:uncharacterized membrane protein
MIDTFVSHAARGFELAGVLVIVAGSLLAVFRYFTDPGYHAFRRRVAHSILLGLELLIAADIIATITVQPTLSSVLTLGLIVLIRTFLSFTLELEATGRLPWQRTTEKRRPEH